MERPADNTKCGLCGHMFGTHFESYDGKQTGCLYKAQDQRDADCRCKGFALIERWGRADRPIPTVSGQMYR